MGPHKVLPLRVRVDSGVIKIESFLHSEMDPYYWMNFSITPSTLLYFDGGPGFELVSSCPFPTTITITPRAFDQEMAHSSFEDTTSKTLQKTLSTSS